jgi:lambda family phage minor tail protein L
MVNAKVSIIDTYSVYLDAVNYPGGVNPTADPSMFTLQTFWLDTKTSEDDEVVSWSLSSPADLQGLVIPTRQITSLCEWALRGQYRSGDGCTYNGTAYFDAKGIRSLTRRWMYAVVASVTAVNDLAPAWQSLTRQFSILAASRQPFFSPDNRT